MSEEQDTGGGLIEAHVALKKRMKLLRIVFPLVIILIVVLNVFGLVRQVKELDTEALASSFESEAHKLWPRLEDDLSLMAAHLQPVLAKELQKQSEAMAPKIEAKLKSDVEAMKVTIERDFQAALEKSLDEIERRQRQILVDQIPSLKDDKKAQDQVLNTVRVSLTKWLIGQLNTTLHEHMIAMDDIFRTLQRSYRAPAGERVSPEDALLVWLDLMNEQIGGADTILAPAKTGKKSDKKKE
jgi:vacuolar-type H+-ATPase subunit F/Vma7